MFTIITLGVPFALVSPSFALMKEGLRRIKAWALYNNVGLMLFLINIFASNLL